MTSEPIALTPKRMTLTFLYLLAYPAVVLALSGDWYWPAGWIVSLWFFGLCAFTIAYLYFMDPALLAERYRRSSPGQELWDRVFIRAVSVLFLVWFIVMPLDARRFHWSPYFPLPVAIAGGVLLIGASFFVFRALADNTFASPLVRLQSERRQRVISSGVYGFVRHPMYLGACGLVIGVPLVLGSLYGLGLGGLLILSLVARIVREEQFLVRKLDGYAGYRQRVKYRLIPYVW